VTATFPLNATFGLDFRPQSPPKSYNKLFKRRRLVYVIHKFGTLRSTQLSKKIPVYRGAENEPGRKWL